MPKLSLTKTYKTYPEYKDSGAGWISGIPANWNTLPFYAVFKENEEINSKGQCDRLLSLSYGNIVEKDITSNSGLLPESFNTYQIVHKNYLILRLTDLQNDQRSLRVGYVKEKKPGIITSAYLGLKLPNGLEPKYAYYLLHAYDLKKVYYGLGGGVRQSIGFDELKRLTVLIPPAQAQEKIAQFLDEKTALIDTIIANKQKLIELLHEKRAAIITQAVTKGLDPAAELVDSGFEWIEKIPKTWEIKRVKHVADVLPSNIDKLTNDGETPVKLCNYTDVYKNENIIREMVEGLMSATATNKQIQRLTLFRHDILLTKDSETPDDIGIPSYVPETLPGVVCGYHLAIIRSHKIYGAFLNRFFLSRAAKVQFFLSANGLTRYALGIGDIGNVVLPIPPNNEQVLISKYLDEKTENCDKALLQVAETIKALKEFKSSLISHAVTGKIKI